MSDLFKLKADYIIDWNSLYANCDIKIKIADYPYNYKPIKQAKKENMNNIILDKMSLTGYKVKFRNADAYSWTYFGPSGLEVGSLVYVSTSHADRTVVTITEVVGPYDLVEVEKQGLDCKMILGKVQLEDNGLQAKYDDIKSSIEQTKKDKARREIYEKAGVEYE